MINWQPIEPSAAALGALMHSGFFDVSGLVGQTVRIEHFTDPAQTSSRGPRRVLAGRVIAVTIKPDEDVAIRFDGLPVYIFEPSDVVRICYQVADRAPAIGMGRTW